MTNKEVINWLTRIRDRLMTTSSKQFEAMTIAIAAMEQQEKDRWRPVTERPPEDYEHVLVSGEKVVKQAQFIKGMFEMEDGEGYAAINSDNIEEPHFYTFKAIAWKPLPEPYTEEEA